jgi:regulator of replication initiation timing
VAIAPRKSKIFPQNCTHYSWSQSIKEENLILLGIVAVSDRLHQLETRIAELQEQLAGLEEALVLSPMEEQTRLKQRIKKLKAEMRPFEEEYWRRVAQQAQELSIPEAEAEVAVAEIVEEVTQLEAYPPANYPDALLQVLREIRDSLNQPSEPETPASAKLKSAISLMPPFVNVSYEGEIDLEKFFQTHFPTFRKLIKAAAKK